jgi:hypothetical protein
VKIALKVSLIKTHLDHFTIDAGLLNIPPFLKSEENPALIALPFNP